MDSEPTRKSRAGRRRHVPPLRKTLVALTDEQMKLLRKWGRGNLSAGLRWLISQAALIVKKEEVK